MMGLDLLKNAKTETDQEEAIKFVHSCLSLCDEKDIHPILKHALRQMNETILIAVKSPQDQELHEKAHDAIKYIYDYVTEMHGS